MDNKIFSFLEYLISTVPTDGNSLFKILIIVVVGYFAIRLMRRFFPDFLFMISNYLKLILFACIMIIIVIVIENLFSSN